MKKCTKHDKQLERKHSKRKRKMNYVQMQSGNKLKITSFHRLSQSLYFAETIAFRRTILTLEFVALLQL